MKKNKMLLLLLFGFLTLFVMNNSIVYADPSKDAKYSVDAQEIEYDMASGDGTTKGKTTIKHDGGILVGQKGATFNSNNRTGHLYGGVVADKDDQHIQSQELFIYSDKYISAVGDALIVKGNRRLEAPRVDYHDDTKFMETLGGSARLTDTDGSWFRAGKITYDMKAGLANATGGVSLESKPRNMTGKSDTAIYNTNETGYIELIGNAVAVQDGNTITGDKLRITNISDANSRSHAQGNVRMVFVPKEDNEEIDNPAFKEGAILIANGQTDFNPKFSILDHVQGTGSDTEERET